MPETLFGKEAASASLTPNTGNLDTYQNNYQVIEYLTNTSSLLITTADKYDDFQVREINDVQLTRYYDIKKQGHGRRHSSIVSGSDFSTNMNKNSSSISTSNSQHHYRSNSNNNNNLNNSTSSIPTERARYEMLMDHFLNCAENKIEPYQLNRKLRFGTGSGSGNSKLPQTSSLNDRLDDFSELFMGKDLVHQFNDFSFTNGYNDNGADDEDGQSSFDIDEEVKEDQERNLRGNSGQGDQLYKPARGSDYDMFMNNNDYLYQSKDMIDMKFVNSYRKYYKKLLTVDFNNLDVLKRHNLWVPIIRDDCKDLLVGVYGRDDDIYTHKTCPLFIKGLNYIPTIYDTFSGCSVMKSIFSEYKFPALTYHCSITMNKQIFMLGGLIPSYRYDAEAPNPSRFFVDGIKNLPPPLLPEIINNPVLVNNPHLYIYSIDSSRLLRPTLSGDIPPPLLCMTASKLTNRHILFYGGFEIKTETKANINNSINSNKKYYLKRSAYLNNTVYILDTVAFHFTKVEVIAQSYQHVRYPTFSARFGHMQVSTNDVENIGFDSDLEISEKDKEKPSDPETTPGSKQSTPSLSKRLGIRGSSTSTRPQMKIMNQPNHNVNISTVIIFGGYRQTGDDKYEAMNDMWKLDIKVIGRGKRNFLKFADTVMAIKIRIDASEDRWPSKRAFFAYNIPPVDINLSGSTIEKTLLKNLEDNFRIDFKTNKETDNINSTVTFDFGKVRSNNSNASFKSSTGPHSVSSSTMEHNPHHSGSSNRNNNNTTGSVMKREGSVSLDKRSFEHDLQTSLHNNNNGDSIMDPLNNLHMITRRNKGRIIVLHGGSNNTEILGDMWWFDLENGTWKQVNTFGTRPEDPRTHIPAEMKLVGHSMSSLGHMAIVAGGLSQSDIQLLYPDNLPLCEEEEQQPERTNETLEAERENAELEHQIEDMTTRNNVMNIINLKTRCIQGFLLSKKQLKKQRERDHPYERAMHPNEGHIRSHPAYSNGPEQSKSHLVTSIGGSIVESDGTVFLIGGLAARRRQLTKMYLRGSLLEFVLPSKSLAS